MLRGIPKLRNVGLSEPIFESLTSNVDRSPKDLLVRSQYSPSTTIDLVQQVTSLMVFIVDAVNDWSADEDVVQCCNMFWAVAFQSV